MASMVPTVAPKSKMITHHHFRTIFRYFNISLISIILQPPPLKFIVFKKVSIRLKLADKYAELLLRAV